MSFYVSAIGMRRVLNISVLVMNRLYINVIVKVNGCASISSDFHPYFLLSYFIDILK